MTIANKLKHFIDGKGVFYDTVEHHRTSTSRQSAIAAHVPGSIMAKSVVVHHELGYALAVVPSTHRIELGTLQSIMDKRLGLASEDEVVSLFGDCDVGAVPPIGAAYDVPVILDESLGAADDVYFEGGDHRTLVHVSGKDFRNLTTDARQARFSHPAY
ncbi:aminoacyl-tRNA deacylase [Mesorhizobium sp. M4B.F.Ca.ET.215.01.1.1]|uniref:aminoacyl-tRNA deacylase n=2 Tax=Phyllobacteriaceae TaxID=69277 RepID=UPI000FCC060D|nr:MULTISPECIES: aminoacyl-tRNA deacylase [unclassified Mesorhizobium]RUW27285.1 aminoacyl-tRNA deacylase [Mesorhizobium sp. M4B.F.Ca.ET.013.02.1.1]RVD39202.1 aminoacyl-tRNA deacylase [Mesorhizobium sp. M4B.F.Ca.ET.019.03.1.1]RWF67246.1 MAG: aminoacyl-tRNA deacylase [Mesorhizobium sp.]TGQ08471.1 aminoacyl-tRNA deacylase [Mesorhizobium sp. M4B.F.Ca.ET.215.01.1.1]TGQ33730.1 aminoacyl-tRNA deacylase [Mesorhizobium sp. M4B.F.Ca.ET.214.01.1.1]